MTPEEIEAGLRVASSSENANELSRHLTRALRELKEAQSRSEWLKTILDQICDSLGCDQVTADGRGCGPLTGALHAASTALAQLAALQTTLAAANVREHALSLEVSRLMEARIADAERAQTYRVTRNIERSFTLSERRNAVTSCQHAVDYISKTRDSRTLMDGMNAIEILFDGIENAIDGRSTGHEFKTVRHRYRNERDGPIPPVVVDADRRCHNCGAINPPHFSHCDDHRPERILAALAPAPLTPDGKAGE